MNSTAAHAAHSIFDRMAPAERAAAIARLGYAPTFVDGRWTFDTTPNPTRTDAVQVSLFAADTDDQSALFTL